VPLTIWILLGFVAGARADDHTYIVEHTILGPTIYNGWEQPIENWVIFAVPGDNVETRRLATRRCYGITSWYHREPDINAIVSTCLLLDARPEGPGEVIDVSHVIRQTTAGSGDFYVPRRTPPVVQDPEPEAVVQDPEPEAVAPLDPWTDSRGLVWDRTEGVWAENLSPAAKAKVAMVITGRDGAKRVLIYSEPYRGGHQGPVIYFCQQVAARYTADGEPAECLPVAQQ
jgi:hypothetical protein